MGDFFNVNGTSIVDSDNILYVKTVTADTLSFKGGNIGSGATNGYAMAGVVFGPPFSGPIAYTGIQKVSFANDATSQHFTFPSGPTAQPNRRMSSAGIASLSHGYASGGYTFPAGYINNAMKFPFSVAALSSNVVNHMEGIRGRAGGAQSQTDGFNFGGFPNDRRNAIDKFPFASEASSAVGSINHPASPIGLYEVKGLSSVTHGYICGGITYPFGYSNSIFKFPFSSNGNASDTADLAVATEGGCTVPNSEIGYYAGGSTAPNTVTGLTNTIQQFNMITDANAVDTGDLAYTRRDGANASSSINGYVIGGSGVGSYPSNNEGLSMVDKFPFASGGNGTDVGDLPSTQGNAAGVQG